MTKLSEHAYPNHFLHYLYHEMFTSKWILWMIVFSCDVCFDAVAAARPEDAVIFCTNTGGPVQMRWRVPNSDPSGTVVIVAPTKSELLECHAGSVSVAPAYKERVQNPTADHRQIQLVLTRVTSKDDGVYECREGSALGRTLDNCRQQLCYIVINKPTIHFKGFELEGQCVMLSCLGTWSYSHYELGLSYGYEWFKDGVPLHHQRQQHLTINNMTQADKGSYTCRITETEEKCATSAESPPFQLHMFMIPSLSIKVSNGTAAVTAVALSVTTDDNVTLICEVHSASPPVDYHGYRWTVTGSGSDDSKPFEETTSRLWLGSLSRQGSGLYTCQAYNDRGFEGWIPPGQTSVNISVFYLTNMVLTPHPGVQVQEGESLSISCKVESNPMASITWYKDGEQSRHIRHNADNFAVLKANRSHSGNYTCLASHLDHRVPSLQSSVNILVLFEPYVMISAKAGLEDLSIPENQTLSVSQNLTLTLTCLVESPLPLNHSHSFNWTFSPKDSSGREGKGRHREGDTWPLHSVTKEDSGRYTCQAWSNTSNSCQMLDTNATVTVTVIAAGGELLYLLFLLPLLLILVAGAVAVVLWRKTRKRTSRGGHSKPSDRRDQSEMDQFSTEEDNMTQVGDKSIDELIPNGI